LRTLLITPEGTLPSEWKEHSEEGKRVFIQTTEDLQHQMISEMLNYKVSEGDWKVQKFPYPYKILNWDWQKK